MLCPELVNFAPPEVVNWSKQNDTLESVVQTVQLNSFYKSLIITCPDEIQTPTSIEEMVTEDNEYYQLTNCCLTEFVELTFIENFIMKGNLYCLSCKRNCIVDNCAAITPDGVLTLHVLEFIYQTLGFQGIKRPHNYYEVKIDLKNVKHNKVRQCLRKLELFDFDITWEPHEASICPSSLAKYFHDRNVTVIAKSLTLKTMTPNITEVPSIKDVDAEEIVEWVGMLAIGGNLDEKEPYISTYYTPQSEGSLQTTRILILIVKGFLTPTLVENVCKAVHNVSITKPIDNYWTSISIQSQVDSLWQWNKRSPKMFQAHDSSFNVFFGHDCIVTYFMGSINYS